MYRVSKNIKKIGILTRLSFWKCGMTIVKFQGFLNKITKPKQWEIKLNLPLKKKINFKKCFSTTWMPFSNYFSQVCQSLESRENKLQAKILSKRQIKSSMIILSKISLNSKGRELSRPELDMILALSNSMLVKYSNILRITCTWGKINVCLCLQMLTCIPRMAGPLFSVWLSKAGGFAFKAMPVTIQTLLVILPNLPECSIQR